MGVMSLFDNAARNTKAGLKKAKLKTNNALLERQITSRKKVFGIEAYDTISCFTTRQDFYAANETWIAALRAPLITADREVRALNNKKAKAEENLNIVEMRKQSDKELIRQNPPTNFKDRMGNFSKRSQLAGHQAKYNTNLGVANVQIRAAKEEFGLVLFPILGAMFVESMGEHEDDKENSSWLPDNDPTHPNILKKNLKSVYEVCAADIAKLQREIVSNRQQMDEMS